MQSLPKYHYNEYRHNWEKQICCIKVFCQTQVDLWVINMHNYEKNYNEWTASYAVIKKGLSLQSILQCMPTLIEQINYMFQNHI